MNQKAVQRLVDASWRKVKPKRGIRHLRLYVDPRENPYADECKAAFAGLAHKLNGKVFRKRGWTLVLDSTGNLSLIKSADFNKLEVKSV